MRECRYATLSQAVYGKRGDCSIKNKEIKRGQRAQPCARTLQLDVLERRDQVGMGDHALSSPVSGGT